MTFYSRINSGIKLGKYFILRKTMKFLGINLTRKTQELDKEN